MTRFAAITGLFLALSLGGCSWDTDVQRAWVRLPASPKDPARAYFEVTGESGGTSLLSAEGPFDRAEFRDAAGNGILEAIPVGGGEKVRFVPGGRHLQIFGLQGDVRPGTSITMRIVENSGMGSSPASPFEAKVVGANDPAPYEE